MNGLRIVARDVYVILRMDEGEKYSFHQWALIETNNGELAVRPLAKVRGWLIPTKGEQCSGAVIHFAEFMDECECTIMRKEGAPQQTFVAPNEAIIVEEALISAMGDL